MVLYTQPNCGKCRMLKMLLSGRAIPYREVTDIKVILGLGITSFPVIDLEDGSPVLLCDEALYFIQNL